MTKVLSNQPHAMCTLACSLALLLACCSRNVVVNEESAIEDSISYSDIFEDPEIRELLAQSRTDENYQPPQNLVQYNEPQDVVVVYSERGAPMKPVSWRQQWPASPFFVFLDNVINKELIDQPYQYRKTVCKIILRYFLILTPSLDSLYARQLGRNQRIDDRAIQYWTTDGKLAIEPQGDRKGLVKMWDVSGEFPKVHIPFASREPQKEIYGTVFRFIEIRQGKVLKFNFWVSYDACGGYWSDCCDRIFTPKFSSTEIIKDIISIGATGNSLDLSGMDLSGFNLTGWNLGVCILSSTNFEDAVVTNCMFYPSKELTLNQIKSTWNYKSDNMAGIILPKELQEALDAERQTGETSP